MGFQKSRLLCIGLLELVSFSSEDSYQLLQVFLFASKDVARDKEQPVLSLEVESARDPDHPDVYLLDIESGCLQFLKEVPA